MQNSLSYAATRVADAPTTIHRFRVRLFLVCLITLLDAAVIAAFGPALYAAAQPNPFYVAGLTVLAIVLLGTLARTWLLTLGSAAR